jgi:serine/threonine-protein kinase PknK
MATLFGRYEYAGELGHGASGRVFTVLDLTSAARADGAEHDKRAVKVVANAESGRLVWEFARLCQVAHPRLARVRELLRLEQAATAPFALPAGALLLVQDFVEGAPLSAAIALAADPGARLALAARVGVAVAEALTALHEASLVHGDVKPDNVICGASGEGATLIDLGFARPPEVGMARGTPAYMSPESFAGVCTPAADVYALGALLYDCLRGEAAHGASSGRAPFRVRDLSLLEPEHESLRRVLAQLLAPDPADRPVDAPAALALLLPSFTQRGLEVPALRYAGLKLVRTPREQAERARTLPLVGHRQALAALVEAIGQAGYIALAGPAGAGRSRLMREALRALQERRAAAGQAVPTWVSSLSALALLRDVDAVLWLDRVRPEALPEIMRAATAAKLALRSLSVVLEGNLDLPRRIELAALPDASFGELLSRLVPKPTAALTAAARTASQGLSGRLCELAAQLALAGRDLSDARSWQASDREPGDEPLQPAAHALATVLAWFGEDLTPEHAALLLGGADAAQAGYDALRLSGLLHSEPGLLVLDPALARKLRSESAGRRAEIAQRALAAGARARSGFARLAAGTDALSAFVERAQALRAQGRTDAACALLADASPWCPHPSLALLHADSERARGRYAEALQALGSGSELELRLVRAELCRLVERSDEARSELSLLQGLGGAPGARATALLARMEFDAGRLGEALCMARDAQAFADREATARALEVELLVCLVRGALHDAPLEALMQAAGTGAAAPSFLARAPARALSLRSQVLARRGDRVRAVADARAAVERARELGEAHEAATYSLNLGLLELERGELGRALETLRDAAQRLARVARTRDLARVLFNFAALALLVGDFARAEVVLDDAERELAGVTDDVARAYIAALRAELLLARGSLDACELVLQRAERELPACGDAARLLLASRLVQVALARGGSASLARVRELHSEDAGARLEAETAELRHALAVGELAVAEAIAQRNLSALDEGSSFADRLRFVLVSIESARANGAVRALAERTALARAWLESALASLPGELRASMRAVPAYARVLATAEATPSQPTLAAERWRELVRASRRLFAETREPRLAARLCEVALELVHAERALLIGFDAHGEASVLARRELAGEASRALGYSRSVLERVALDGRPLMTVEAASDARLERAESVAALHVRSVLCAELTGLRGRAFLYLDDRLRPSAFGDADLALVEDLLELARQALHSAAEQSREARRARRAELSQKRLSRELARGLEQPQAVPSMIGESPGLARVVASARRIALSDAPVLITGESGTGKELLARFVHDESPRKARAFVAENCAALPDTLLESALFGHVRGAFTGAERSRRGLFEIADGGTLFLDEVGEMSPLLQGKLLRVLQEGELRPLGSERTRAVDVRVIGATRRNLRELVQRGAFREDLFYRLAVVTLELPPLRERREDIPRLVKHFLDKHGKGALIQPGALRALELRDWPGNVRELENELRRALALSDGEIELAHLSPAEQGVSEGPPSELDLHAHTDRLTRRLVRDAMGLAEGNVTRAAALLGVSRFGLQKILKRLQLPAK